MKYQCVPNLKNLCRKDSLKYNDAFFINGVSSVYMDSNYGTIKGKARTANADMKYCSEHFGGEIAEIRARCNYNKMILPNLWSEYRELQNAYKEICSLKGVNEDSIEMRRLRKILYRKLKKIRSIQNSIKNTESRIKRKDEQRQEVLKKLYKDKNN